MDTVYYGLNPLYWRKRARLYGKNFISIPDTPLPVDVGRLIPVKAHDTLIQAFVRVVPSFPNIRLFIVGDGVLKKDLKDLARKLGLGEHVLFTGYRKDVPRLMRVADLSVFPTLGKGFGLVLLEAMALRKPVVATKVMSVPEIVENGKSGLLVSP